ncbi:hypothetical protein CNECB9_2420004 [Cupriavidus necator]|uniref:Uncharacterized protein n=1 Tax=Cupriavidus necator TaxID=106590 RepID=A0A1K0J985_CUPNE|nr:hypothetical protein CNECB9_2420004 [Cupriavidus necator]
MSSLRELRKLSLRKLLPALARIAKFR